MTSFENYAQRVEEAAKIAGNVASNKYSKDESDDLLRQVKELLPATEDIAREVQDKDITHVDNAWLHRLIDNLEEDDDDKRSSQLVGIANRLTALGHRLRESQRPAGAEAKATQERLQQILARSEYQPDETKDSAIQGWIKKIQQKIRELLAKLFFKNPSAAGPSPGSLQALRWLIIVALIASLGWATVLLIRRFQLRQAKLKDDESENETREILGEQFDADVTADHLMRTAAEMARKGEYRMAIRRAYLALLYDLEQRGKLRLHRAKTNRDYLGELKNEQYIYPPVSVLTNNYERVWYGHGTATMEDYAGFIEKYREVAR
ncbi:MAG: DUF4129 domain-containing protein [Acidobacteria bacterium]|nr:DUF4129 domain-containing protein [Acidobacteriota bacterium]